MARLPVSGQEVVLLPPTGADELWAHEAQGSPLGAGLGLVARLARARDGGDIDASSLAVTDFEALLLLLREHWLGPVLRSDFDCPDCGERMEASFSVGDFLSGVQPRRPREVADAGRSGWLELQGAGFRLPTVGDQAEVEGRPDAAGLLAARCLEPPSPPRPLRARIERAMAAMAPEVSRPIAGRCQACGGTVRALFHAPSFVLAELRRAAAGVLEEVHLIASAYHWAEAVILALPSPRRRAYAERIRADRLALAAF